MKLKIICRCSLFPSWSGYGLINTPALSCGMDHFGLQFISPMRHSKKESYFIWSISLGASCHLPIAWDSAKSENSLTPMIGMSVSLQTAMPVQHTDVCGRCRPS